MNEPSQDGFEERHVPFVSGDTRLDIVVTKTTENEWSLSIINELGISSTWYDCFESADAAIQIALRAIQEEGIQEFTSVEGFEYLNDT